MPDALPPCRIASPQIDAEGLADDQCWQSVQIQFANAPVDDQVAHYPKQDETVETSIENAVMEPEIKSANGNVHEFAGRYEDKAAMIFRLLPPINRSAISVPRRSCPGTESTEKIRYSDGARRYRSGTSGQRHIAGGEAILLWIAWENQLQSIAAVASDCNEKAVPLRHSYKHFGHSDAIHAIRCAKNANQ